VLHSALLSLNVSTRGWSRSGFDLACYHAHDVAVPIRLFCPRLPYRKYIIDIAASTIFSANACPPPEKTVAEVIDR
jgi:hypothetical protein